MVRLLLSVVGGLLVLRSLFLLGRHVLEYNRLTAYGQGYLWGQAILLLVGAALLYFGLRRRPAQVR